MKYLGQISDPADLTNKGYVDQQINERPLFVRSDTPPEHINQIWVNGSDLYYWDSVVSEWVSFAVTTNTYITPEETSYTRDSSTVSKTTPMDSPNLGLDGGGLLLDISTT